MIFQPTNVSPSLRGQLGNGVIDVNNDLTVSWQVNGNSAMTAFVITIYENDAASTQVYTTGTLTDDCPFYGTDANGDIQLFSYTIESATLTGAGMANDGEYKLVITQYWNADDYVTQTSAAAFITRDTPTLALDNMPVSINTTHYTFTATYTQAQGDALNWVRWQIAKANDTANPIYDSHNIYGTALLSLYYDEYMRDTQYAVKCSIQTANGVEADTGWQTFGVSYGVSELDGYVIAEKDCTGRSAVKVQWPLVTSIYPAFNGSGYSIHNRKAHLPYDAGTPVWVDWSTVNGADMSFAPLWTFYWAGNIPSETNYNYFIQIKNDEMAIYADFNNLTNVFTVYRGPNEITGDINAGATLASFNGVSAGDEAYLIITPTTIYLRVLHYSGGLYPDDILYPDTTLYPDADDITILTYSATYSDGTDQQAVTGVRLMGAQVCYYWGLLQGDVTDELLAGMYDGNDYVPVYDTNSYAMADFANGWSAGLLHGSLMVSQATVYRQDGDGTLHRIGAFPITTGTLYDYGVVNGGGPYVYQVYPDNGAQFLSEPFLSGAVDPCFWDWSVLECEAGNEDGLYSVVAEYRFGKNLSTGAISNNNAPSVLNNFTPYPIVQTSPSNYKSGALSSLIGIIDYASGNAYSDTLAMRDAIFNLSLTDNELFLKSRKGDLIHIRISGAISMATMDNSKEQAQTVTLNWVEIGSADGVSLIETA